TSSSSTRSRENIFIPKRNSFGIVIKPFDPTRSPSRARRAQSRSRSRSRSQSRDRLDFSSRNGSRSSLASTTSKGKIDKRKSMSMGDLDLDDEFVVLDNEIYQEEKRKKTDSRSLMRKLSRIPGRAKSKEELDNFSSSDEASFFDNSKPMPLHRQRSIEFSVSESPFHQNQSLDKRNRSVSESTAEASFKLDQRKNIIIDENFNSSSSEARSRASQHEKVKVQSIEEAHRRSEVPPVNNQFQKNNRQTGRPAHAKPSQFISVPHQQPTVRKSKREMEHWDSSDEGTDLDNQPRSRPTDNLLCDSKLAPSSQPVPNKHFPHRSSYTANFVSMNDTSTYMNADDSQPLLLSSNPPELPPKSFMSPPLPPKSQAILNSSFSRVESDTAVMQQVVPPLPPKNVTSSKFTGSSLSENISFVSPPATHYRKNVHHANAQHFCEHHQNAQNSCHLQNGHTCEQNFCLSQTQMPHFHPQRFQNHVCVATPCVPPIIQNQQCSHWNGQNALNGNDCNAQGIPPLQWNIQPIRDVNRSAATESHQMHDFTTPLLDRRHYAQSASLLGAHRQFKSTANLRSDEFAHEKENVRFSKVPKMHKAKSTDVLTCEGTIKEDPEVENLDTSKRMKKAKSTIVLDDLSLSSEPEPAKPLKPKPKLSEDRRRGVMEMCSGLVQLFTICSCLLITVPMAILSKNWDWNADRCPLYVESNMQHDRLWGNPSMIPCYLSAYMPVVIMAISLTLLFVHGGLLFFWRSERRSSSFYMRRSFSLSLLFFSFVSFCVALAVACMLTDGLRQTCLSFQFISDIDYRPTNCQNGFNGLDLNYNIEGSFYYIIFAMIGAWLTVIDTILYFILCLGRAKVCSCS
ncbi:hypothetical protein FHG87_003468, partial [Trinorchestia longiramus]